MRCRRLPTSTTDHRRLLGAPRAANRRIPPAWLPSDARRLGARARANTLHATRRWRACGRGVLSKKNPGDTGPRRQQDSTLVRPRPRLIAHREPKKYRFHPQVLAVSVSLDHERTERSSNPLADASLSPHVGENCGLRSSFVARTRLLRELRDKELAWHILFQLPWLRVLFC